MTYDEAVRYLLLLGAELAAPRQPGPAKFGLRNIELLAERLGHPHRKYPCVHVAGTNGKGSTAAMLESILRHAGLRTGLYISPHLERINERITLNGQPASDAAFAQAFQRVRAQIEPMLAAGALAAHPTFFECITAMAFDAFARHPVDFAVFEVGMGGRLDSTNIVAPEVAVITPIDFDHENYLGHSIEAISGEKAGICKPGVPVVTSAERPEARAVIRRRAEEMNARLVEIDAAYEWRLVGAGLAPPAGDAGVAPTSVNVRDLHSGWQLELTIPLRGRFQIRNAVTAVAAARLLAERGFPVTDPSIAAGIAQVRWPGRLEQLQERPAVFLDGTHNTAGARELLAFWNEAFAGRRIHVVYGAVRDKAVDEVTGLLFPRAATVILTQPRQPRTISAQALAEMSGHHAAAFEVIADPAEAFERAIRRAAPEDVVFATGSLYLVGDLRRWWKTRSEGRAEKVSSEAGKQMD